MDKFYKLATKCHEARVKEEQSKIQNLKLQAEQTYSIFCIWCRINNKEPNESSFKDFCKQKEDVSFWVKKKLFELYFNYEFVYNYDTNKWVSIKNKNA